MLPQSKAQLQFLQIFFIYLMADILVERLPYFPQPHYISEWSRTQCETTLFVSRVFRAFEYTSPYSLVQIKMFIINAVLKVVLINTKENK